MSEVLPQPVRVWRARVFAATWLSYFGFYFCRKPFYSAKATFAEQFDWDPSTLSYIATAYLLAYAAGQFASGWLGDRLGARVLLLTGMAVTAVANAGFGFANSWQTFLALMIVNGLAQATGWSGNVGTMGSWFHRGERGAIMGVWGTNYMVGGFVATGLSGYLLDRYGVPYAFSSLSVVMLGIWAFFLFNQRNRPEDLGFASIDHPDDEPTSEADDAPWDTDTIVNVLLIGVFYFFVKFIRYALWSWAPFLFETELGVSTAEASYLSTVFDIAGTFGLIGLGMVSDRVFAGRRVTASFLSIAGMVAACLLLYTVGTSSVMMFSVSMGLIGFTLYGPDALMSGAAAVDVGSARRAVLAAGIINGCGSLGSVVQELLLGKVLDGGDTAQVFAILLGSSLCAAGMLGVLMWRNRSGKADL